jgi:hypothetical protein
VKVSPASPLIPSAWLRPLRILWVICLGLTLVTAAVALPLMYSQAHELCTHASCNGPQLTAAQTRSLHHMGLSLDFYGASVVAMNLAFIVVYSSIAALIFLRRSHERMAMLSAFFLLVFGGMTFPGTPDTMAAQYPLVRVPAGLITISGAALLALFFFLFPSGRFVPRWAPWLVPILPALQAPAALFPGSAFTLDKLPPVVDAVAFVGTLVVMLGAQVYRFRRVSTAVERQQTKWVVLGVGVGLGGFLVFVLVGASLPASATNSFLGTALPNAVMYLLMMLIPLSIALAVLRYNLWETDLLINRTLVYGSLTLTLAGFYILGVIAVQSLFRTITGQSSDLAIAIVTLAVAALFNPWRHRVQAFIDRRFYRHKYDAARILAGFSARLRDDVDLSRLESDIVAVVAETMQPVRISLWLPREDVP